MNSNASATSSDFKQCVLLKTKILEYCLKDDHLKNNEINISDYCQKKLTKSYQNCHKRVVKKYKPMSKAEQEAFRIRKEALIKQKQLEKRHTN